MLGPMHEAHDSSPVDRERPGRLPAGAHGVAIADPPSRQLGHAAQAEMAEAIQRDDDPARELAYGKWLGVRGILRAIEARFDEWTPREREMLARVDWPSEQFRFPGIEAFDVELTEPGA